MIPALADSEDSPLQDADLANPDSIWTLGTWDIKKGYSLGTYAFPGLHHDPVNTAHAFLDYSMEAEDNVPQILQGKAAARGWQL